MDEKKLDYTTVKRVAIICCGLSITAVVALTNIPAQSDASRLVAYSLAVSIPTLVGFFLFSRTRTKPERRSLGWVVPALAVLGFIATIIGVTALLAIVSPGAAWTFCSISFVVGGIYLLAGLK